jgi:hypothetical protein
MAQVILFSNYSNVSNTSSHAIKHRCNLSWASRADAIFRGLQEQIKEILTNLPPTTARELVLGLMDAHRKLSDYYYKFDEPPLYTWAAHT